MTVLYGELGNEIDLVCDLLDHQVRKRLKWAILRSRHTYLLCDINELLEDFYESNQDNDNSQTVPLMR